GSCRENPKSRDICTPALGFRAQGRRNGTACTHTLVRAHGHAGPGPCGRCAGGGHSAPHCGLDGPCKITAHPPACAPLPPPPTESAQAYLLNAPIPALRGLTSIMRTPLLGTLATLAGACPGPPTGPAWACTTRKASWDWRPAASRDRKSVV